MKSSLTKQPTHLAVLLLTQDVLDLAMRLGVVGAVLHEVEFVRTHGKRLKHCIELGAGDKDLGAV